MAEVKAIKVCMAQDNYADIGVSAEDKYQPMGQVSAYVMVEAVGFNGLKVFRRVRIGHEFGVTPETAKAMVDNVREANAAGVHYNNPPIISGRFIMDL
jgi:hypothetical protein